MVSKSNKKIITYISNRPITYLILFLVFNFIQKLLSFSPSNIEAIIYSYIVFIPLNILYFILSIYFIRNKSNTFNARIKFISMFILLVIFLYCLISFIYIIIMSLNLELK